MAEARVKRRLAAILAGDVAGYSRLMGNDEEGTLAALKACHRDVIDPKVAEHHGRIVNSPGDAVLIEFASAVDAGHCARVREWSSRPFFRHCSPSAAGNFNSPARAGAGSPSKPAPAATSS